jgi:hypothetical protein
MTVPDPAEAYDGHVGRYGAELAAGLIEVAGVRHRQRALDEAAPDRAAQIDDGRRVGYPRPEELGALFEECGLADVATGELHVGAHYKNFDELWRPFTAGVGHSGSCCAALDMAGQADLRADLHRRLGSPAAPFRLTARAWWARGRVR